ncbi:MAG: hypothetical protein U0M42_00510 [Acutalibacteraceae bacterium]|nr:hypothetical protein [Acutalibacteraceae bacterium]
MKTKTGIIYFHSAKHQHDLRVATFIMFLSLIVEKALSGAKALYSSGHLVFTMSFSITDIISILVYISVAILLALKVRYTFLLIPDFALLGVKLYTAFESIHHLIFLSDTATDYEMLSYFSKASESLLFSVFLVLLFIGKLFHTKRAYSKNYPFVCMRLIIACFPVTVIFEVLKMIIKMNSSTYPFIVIFDFLKNILNEAFLDLPYLLLLLLMAFVPQNRYYKQ